MNKTIRILIILLAIVAVLLGGVCLAVSPVAKYAVNNYGKQIVGRSMQVEGVAINLLSGGVRIENFTLFESDDSTAFVSLRELDTKANLWRLLSNTVDIRHIRLNGLDANIIQRGSDFNFDDIIEFYASPADTLETAASVDSLATDEGSGWSVELNGIALNEGYIHYNDMELDASLGLHNLNLMIPALYFSNRNSDVDIAFTFDEGGTLRTHLAYCIEQGDFTLHLDLDSLNLGSLQPYVQQFCNVGSFAGRLDAAIDLAGNLNHIMDFDASGTLDLGEFSVNDTNEQSLARINALHVGLTQLSLLRRTCLFDTVQLKGAHVTAVMDREGNLNLAQLLREEESDDESDNEPTPAADTTESEPFELRIGKLELGGIGIDYTDHTMHQPFSYALSEIALRCHNFDLAGTNRAFMSARLGSSGRANITWNGTLHDLSHQKLAINVENLRMADFSPFCYEYTSYPLTAGNMTFSSDNVVSNSRLSSNNHLDVYQCSAGHKDKGYKAEYSNIPVRMGLYLLKDMDEHIKMDIPVSGTLGSPEFSFRKIVFRTIGNAMLKVVASPFVFLKSAGSDLKDIPFDPASHTFTTQQYESLTTIADAIKAKPEMQITLRQHANTNGLQQQFEQMALMRDYHNSLTDKPTDKLSAMDTERIAALSYSSDELNSYSNRRLVEQGMAADTTATLAEKRTKLYAEQAARQINMLGQMRNRLIRDYVISQQGVADSLFRVEDASPEIAAHYKGRSRYTIEVTLGDESITLNDDNETNATSQNQ